MRRAAKLTTLAILSCAAIAAATSASAQVIAYRHRSTVFGDHAAGAAELVRARGAYLRDEVAAARQWVDVAAAQDQLWYQRAEMNYRVKQMELDYIKQKAANNRERDQLNTAAEVAAAQELLQSAQRGVPMWPAALRLEKFAGSMGLIESLLRHWAPNELSGNAFRQALATEAGVLRVRIANDASIAFTDRVEAVQTLQRLQLLAGMSAEAVGAVPQIAMR